MTMEFRNGRFVSRIFYTELDETMTRKGNLMGMVYRDGSAEPWQVVYRFRYVVDNDLTRASKDKKSWFGGTCGDELGTVRSNGALLDAMTKAVRGCESRQALTALFGDLICALNGTDWLPAAAGLVMGLLLSERAE